MYLTTNPDANGQDLHDFLSKFRAYSDEQVLQIVIFRQLEQYGIISGQVRQTEIFAVKRYPVLHVMQTVVLLQVLQLGIKV